MDRVQVGVVGCGAISSAYFKFAGQFPILDIVACADLDRSRSEARAEQFAIPTACSVDELLARDGIEIVVNLTVPAAHAAVALRAIAAGKHVYSEKPLALDLIEGRRVLEAAEATGVRVANAPDTFLGTSHQTCRALVEQGAIGQPLAATAAVLGRGPEGFHADPEFFFKPGGGPMFDMGPYYLTAMLNLLGPIRRVAGIAGIQIPVRTITSELKHGTTIDVEVPDHVSGSIEFASGAIGTIVASFATMFPRHDGAHPITIYGTEGTLAVPDPNGFEGPVLIQGADDPEYRLVEGGHTHPNGRALGVADLAHAIRSGRPHRASGSQALAVLEAMVGFEQSSRTGRSHELASSYEKPAPVPPGLADGVLDD